MNEQECHEAYEQLTMILRSIQMDWVVQLAAEEISSGAILKKKSNSKTRQLEIFRELDENSRTSKKKLPDIEIREYTSQEKLKILINYIKQAIVDPQLIQKRTSLFFTNEEYFDNLNSIITFISSTDESTFIVDGRILEEQLQETEDLMELLEELTREIESDIER